MKTSNLFQSTSSSRIARISLGWNRSAHSGHAILTRLSVISIFKYCLRQSRHERWWHVMMGGKWSRDKAWRHSGHSSMSAPLLPPRDRLLARTPVAEWEVLALLWRLCAELSSASDTLCAEWLADSRSWQIWKLTCGEGQCKYKM